MKFNAEIRGLAELIASQPVYYSTEKDSDTSVWLCREKSINGFQLLAESLPSLINSSPMVRDKIYPYTSTSARMVYEFGMDCSIASAAAVLGYFCCACDTGVPKGEYGTIEVCSETVVSKTQALMRSSSSIGTSLIAIGSEAINLWPKENAIMRIQDEITSLLLHLKLALVPFGSIIIFPTGDMSWLKTKINFQSVAQEAGLQMATDSLGRIRLTWEPQVPVTPEILSQKTCLFEGFSASKGRLSFSTLLRDTLAKSPLTLIPMSSRLELALESTSPTYLKPSVKRKLKA